LSTDRFSETTCEDITNAADVGKGTFFNYFPSKHHILVAFAEMQLSTLRAFVEEARRTSQPTLQLLQKLGESMTVEPSRTPEITRMLLLANLSTEPVRTAMCAYQEEGLSLLSQLIEIGQQRGEIRADCPAVEIVGSFRHVFFGTLLLWSLRPDVPLKQRIDSSLQLLWNGIAGPSGRAAPSAAPRPRE
jgi:AcrR family transcriptional regulator